jgi:1-acyl-sn-glycerol-3-phosphate acyltransferase
MERARLSRNIGAVLMPAIGPAVPRWGNPLTRGIGRTVLRVFGWHFEGVIPDVPKLVAIAAPHTCTADVFLGLAVIVALGVRVRWLGKHTIFWPPLGSLLRWFGGIPVNRAEPGGMVAVAAAMVRSEPRLFLGLAPEGTRARVPRWKSGFHRIAAAAGVPILPVALDYSRRRIVIGPPLMPSADYERDLTQLKSHFRARMARHPERYAEG